MCPRGDLFFFYCFCFCNIVSEVDEFSTVSFTIEQQLQIEQAVDRALTAVGYVAAEVHNLDVNSGGVGT